MSKPISSRISSTVSSAPVDPDRLEAALRRLLNARPRFRRLWAYFRNPQRIAAPVTGQGQGSERPYRQAQEWGLPPRITGLCAGAEPFADISSTGRARKEVVIENDIAWRIDTMSDYLFGKPFILSSAAKSPARRDLIGRLLRAILARAGGIHFFQQLATLGSVHGFVDVLVKFVPNATSSPSDPLAASGAPSGASPGPTESSASSPGSDNPQASDPGSARATDALIERIARMIRLEIVEPARALPLLNPRDCQIVDAYAQVWESESRSGSDSALASLPTNASRWWDRLRALFSPTAALAPASRGKLRAIEAIELITPERWLRLESGQIVSQGLNSLGRIPLVHIQNTAETFAYAGASDVEPLIPLQDELNTRLSDRAHRITLQSFKMYLGKGIEQFNDQPVSPGRMWMTDNEQASIQEFGGDSGCPSEEAHIADIREALDKTSGVTPIAAGAIKNRIGRLTSAAALRITLLALLSKTDKKRALYGAGIERLCELALAWLDNAGVFPTDPAERGIEINWPSPLPENEIEKLQEAEIKLRLGVDKQTVLKELGY